MMAGLPLAGGPDHQHDDGLAPWIYPARHADDGAATCRSTLRPYQVQLIDEIGRALADGCHRVMVQMPTGGGKTLVAAVLTNRCRAAGGRTIFTAPALSLIDQTVEKFYAEDIRDLGVLQADHPLTNPGRPVQIASVQTLVRRCIPPADLVILDEAHRWFDAYEGWLADEWRNIPVIGLSATPWTKGLGKFFDKLIVGSTTQELINAGYLSPFRVFAPASPDLVGVRVIAGDYHEGDLSKAMDKAPLVADVVSTWLDRGQNRPTLCFAVDCAHAKHLQEQFSAAGVEAAYIDAYTEAAERREIARQFHSGHTKVVVNVGCLTIGVDWDVRCLILARPTRSEMLFVQMIGRGLRTAPGKADCLILDHSDNHLRLGFATDIHHDELDDGRPRPKAQAKPTEKLPKKCPKCAFLKPPGTLACPCCGFIPVAKSKITNREGELVEMLSRSTPKPTGPIDHQGFYAELKFIACERGYKPGWIAHKYHEKFGRWPDNLKHLPPKLPSFSTRNWVRSRQIAWAKSRPQRAAP